MKRIKYFIRSFKRINTIEDAILMNLSFQRNIYGDQINYYDCRSLWVDEYEFVYYCEQYYNSKGLMLRKMKIKKLFSKINI